MPDSNSIPSTSASFPEYLDFQKLRDAGIEHCQALSSDIWTDFNLHDPGLTILETLCFAITDLGYRTSLPIEDLLTRNPEQGSAVEDVFGNDGKAFDDNFFTAEQILTCNPVTLLDMRKMLIDVRGVRNAWIRPVNDGRLDDDSAPRPEPDIYLNDRTGKLQLTKPEHLLGDETRLDQATLKLDGLYLVMLELDDDVELGACGARSPFVDEILANVRQVLNRHRNLCEDFVDIVVLGEEQVALCVDVEISAAASHADVLLTMYQALDAHLSPTLTFYSLPEMLARDKRIEEIYAGRPLTPLVDLVKTFRGGRAANRSHGFIDTEQLEHIEPRSTLQLSDLYQVIMDVEGVLAVRGLSAVNYVNGRRQTSGEKWCLRLTPMHRQRFDLQRSKIVFYKDQLPMPVGAAEKDAAEQRFREAKTASAKAPLENHQLDRLAPYGRHRREFADYQSVVGEFPLVYGISDGGLPETASAARKAQAHQLRAYLLFYDQILANYLAQLANLRELFSMRPDGSPHRRDDRNHTYFAQPLRDGPGVRVRDLVRNYSGSDSNGADFEGCPGEPDDYDDYLKSIVEGPEEYASRRNRFLDHLLARFAESFTDYVLLMFDLNGQKNDDARIIRDKTSFLMSYPETSRNRGRAFNNSHSSDWDADNISGLEKRVRRLLGLGRPECSDQPHRRTLGNAVVVQRDDAWHWQVQLRAQDTQDGLVLASRHGFPSRSDAEVAFADFRNRARDFDNYRRLTYSDFRHLGFGVLAAAAEAHQRGDRPVLAEFPRLFAPHGGDVQRRAAMEQSADFFASETPAVSTEQEGTLHHFVVRAELPDFDPAVFRSRRGYATAGEAEQAGMEFVAQAADLNQYVRFSRGGFDHHGFAVVDLEETILAEVEHPWPLPETRERYLHQLLQAAIGGDVRCEFAFHKPDRIRYQLFDEPGELLLLESVREFSSEAEGEAAFHNELLPLAKDGANYRDIADNNGFGFELVAADEVVATHPRVYGTTVERDLWRRGIAYDLSALDIGFEITGAVGELGFVLLDPDGAALLRSHQIYPDAEAATAAFDSLLVLARDRENYRTVEAEGEHGFQVHGDAGPVAVSVVGYATAGARDAALFVTMASLKNRDVVPVLHNLEGAYAFDVKSPDGELLLNGTEVFSSSHLAKQRYRQLLLLGRDRDRYRATEVGPDDCRYGLELRDEFDAVVAQVPGRFATAADRDAARARLFELMVDATTVTDFIRPARQFVLVDRDGRELLRSEKVYNDPAEAERDFDLVRQATNEALYSRVSGEKHTFRLLREQDGDVVAIHPVEYSSSAEREAALADALFFIQSKGVPHQIVAEATEHFRFVLRDEFGATVLKGKTPAKNVPAARLLLLAALARAADSAAYENLDEPKKPSFSFQLVGEEGSPLAVHPVQHSSPQDRDHARDAWIEFVTRVSLEPQWETAAFCYQLADGNQRVLMRSEGQWDRETAEQKFREEFAPLSQDEANYARHNRSGAETYSFDLKNKDGEVIAHHPERHSSCQLRDEMIDRVLSLVRVQTLERHIHAAPSGFYFRLVGDDELVSTGRYTNSGAAAAACSQVFGKLTHAAAYSLEPDGDDLRLVLSAANEQVRAESAPGNQATLTAIRDRMMALASVATPLPHAFIKVDAEHHCQLTDNGTIYIESWTRGVPILARLAEFASAQARDEAIKAVTEFFKGTPEVNIVLLNGGHHFRFEVNESLQIQSSAAYSSGELAALAADEFRALPPTAAKHYRPFGNAESGFGFEILPDGASRRSASQVACQGCNRFVELAQENQNYRRVESEDRCLYALELTDGDGHTLGKHFEFFKSAALREQHIETIRCLADSEGFHLVEHILLRPKNAGAPPALVYELDDGDAGTSFFRSTATFADGSSAIGELRRTLDRFVAGDDPIRTFRSGACFAFQLVDDEGHPIAAPSAQFATALDRDAAIDTLRALVLTRFSDDQQREPAALDRFIRDTRGPGATIADRLLPASDGCADATGRLCPVRADNYSFRATVVVPYWPSRFRSIEFRRFFERTLRLETPAHVFPRICWVDVCQMREFETAFRRWLCVLANPATDCERTSALNALLDVLVRLKSVYSTARLFGCGGESVTQPMILDQTILGTGAGDGISH